MKKSILIAMFLVILLSCVGCDGEEYVFKQSLSEIQSIEVISAKSSIDFVVLKTLSEDEKEEFITRFRGLEFNSYYFGDPMAVAGNAVKFTYSDGNYEVICDYWAEYVENGEVYSVRKKCNEYEFNELLNYFLNTPAENNCQIK